MLCLNIVVKNILSFTQFRPCYKKKTACVVNKSLSSNYFKLILIMKSLYHILALKCDFGADTSLLRPADFLRKKHHFNVCHLVHNVANLHYNIKTKMTVIVNMVYYH